MRERLHAGYQRFFESDNPLTNTLNKVWMGLSALALWYGFQALRGNVVDSSHALYAVLWLNTAILFWYQVGERTRKHEAKHAQEDTVSIRYREDVDAFVEGLQDIRAELPSREWVEGGVQS